MRRAGSRPHPRDRRAWLDALGWLALVAPAAVLALRASGDALGPEPVETLTHVSGEWAMRWLWACLAVTPLRRALGWAALAPWRRRLGLAAYAYACLHFSVYVGFDLGFDLAALGEDVSERPWLTAGFSALLLMTPLALTSTRRSQRRLGRRWRALHRLAYVAAIAAALHFVWLVKADLVEPLIYAAVLALVLVTRVRLPHPSSRSRDARAEAPDPGRSG